MKAHEKLVEAAREAIEKVFSDTSVSPEKTDESLRELAEEIDFKLNAIRADRKRAGRE